jgi:serine/threonine protein kinase
MIEVHERLSSVLITTLPPSELGYYSRAVGVVLPQPIQFGKYTLFERIGRGGMADVFKARVQGPAGFERVFVVKRILPHLSEEPQFTRMFIEEAKLSARLNHPNIVQVFELGAVDKEYFIAMEYVRGRDLAETMRTFWARVGPPRPELVAYIGREMCRALAYAHDLTGDDGDLIGMIHRDVSPSNVMLSYEGAVKLLDFGIAKALGGESKEESGTQRGTLKGKFAYMAPEQTQGSDVDRRIDIFAAGIVLHEILTGRRLFKGENDMQTVERVRQCEVSPPSMQNPLCPPEMDAIILRALARDRDERFQSAAEMADALDDVVHAARFQPTHLAALMRELFPTDTAGGGKITGAMSLSGSQSRPHSSAMRSPTVPALTVSRPPSRPSFAQIDLPPPQVRTGPSRRALVIGGVATAAIAMGVGAAITRSTTLSAGANKDEAIDREFEIAVISIPVGAEIWQVGENKKLGVTDTYLKFKQRGDARISLVFKKEGYLDEVREVSPYTMLVHLKQDPNKKARDPQAPPKPADEPSPPTPAPSGTTTTVTPPAAAPPTEGHPGAPGSPPGTAPSSAAPSPSPSSPPSSSPSSGGSAPAARPPARRKILRPNETLNPFGGSSE